jgi:hypothetical protein
VEERTPTRSGLLKKYADKQTELRRVMEQADKLSRTNLIRKIADLENKNAQLQAQRDTLIASHKAMLLAVGEMGGMAAWHYFFASWQETIDSLKPMGAMPSAPVLMSKSSVPWERHASCDPRLERAGESVFQPVDQAAA